MRKLYTPWIVLPLAVAAMVGLMYAAVTADCTRLAAGFVEQLESVDVERVTLEKRYFDLVKRRNPQTTEVFTADNRDFHATAERFRAEIAANPTAATPEEKRFRDDVLGVINRWDAVDREYQQILAEQKAFAASLRGSLAQKQR